MNGVQRRIGVVSQTEIIVTVRVSQVFEPLRASNKPESSVISNAIGKQAISSFYIKESATAGLVELVSQNAHAMHNQHSYKPEHHH